MRTPHCHLGLNRVGTLEVAPVIRSHGFGLSPRLLLKRHRRFIVPCNAVGLNLRMCRDVLSTHRTDHHAILVSPIAVGNYLKVPLGPAPRRLLATRAFPVEFSVGTWIALTVTHSVILPECLVFDGILKIGSLLWQISVLRFGPKSARRAFFDISQRLVQHGLGRLIGVRFALGQFLVHAQV